MAALAIHHAASPHGIYENHLNDLQQTLMDDDCHLPWQKRDVSALSREASLTSSEGNPEPLRNGVDRSVGTADNGWTGNLGSWIQYTFAAPRPIRETRLVFDSDLNRNRLGMRSNYPLNQPQQSPPASLVKSFRLETSLDGVSWHPLLKVEENHQRLVRLPCPATAKTIRFIPESTWGAQQIHLFSWEMR